MTRPVPTSLLPIDIEILRQALRFTAIRPIHAVAWTGASPWTVRASLRRLVDAGMVTRRSVTIDLRDRTNRIVSSPTVVYVATTKGAASVGAWFVPGYEDAITLSAPRPSAAVASHTDGVAGLAAWYRYVGYGVVAEREIVSMERPSKLVPGRLLASHWAVMTASGVLHPPDLVAVTSTGRGLAVELERATKTVNEYVQVVGAYRAAGTAQAWHVLSDATAKRLAQACHLLGIRVVQVDGVSVSEDGLFRLQGWLPGPSAGGGPEMWAATRLVPRVPPAGIAVPTPRPDLSLSWRRGSVVDPDVPLGPESVMIA